MDTGVPLLSPTEIDQEQKIRALGRILIDVSGHRLSVDGILGDSFLIDTHGSNCTQCTRVDFGTPIGNDAHDDLLPSILTPSLTPISFAQVDDVLHNTVHGPSEELLVFVVHGENDEQFRSPGRVVQDLTQGEPGVLEFIGVTSGSRISHVGELSFCLERTPVKQLGRDCGIQNKVSME